MVSAKIFTKNFELLKHLKKCIEKNELNEMRPCQIARRFDISDAAARSKLAQAKKRGLINFEGFDYSTIKILVDI